MGKREATVRHTNYRINLDNYGVEGNIYDNEEIMEIIKTCAKKIDDLD